MLHLLRELFAKPSATHLYDERQYRIYKDVEDISNLGHWELNLKTDKLWWSDRVYQIFELSPDHFKPSYEAFIDLVHPDDRDKVDQAYSYSVENNKPYELKHRLKLPDGIIKVVIEKGKTFYDRYGSPLRSVGSVQDVTTLETLEAQLRTARKMETLGFLVGGIVHDFNNLLGVIMGYTNMLQEENLSEQERINNMKEIIKAVEKSTDITSQLLSFSHQENGLQAVVDVNERIMNLNNILRQLSGDHTRIEYKLAARPANVLIGPAEFDQIIINLVSNSALALPEGGTIQIITDSCQSKSNDGILSLRVVDNGSGISPENQTKVFDPFFSTRTKNTSSGLGLSTVASIVKNYRGTISIHSEPGQGTSMEIQFPLCSQCNMVSDCEECYFDPDASKRKPFKQLSIMVVEDDQMMRNLVTNMLCAIGCEVQAFASPNEAEQYFQENHESVDIVIADVVMPSLSGAGLVKRLQNIRPDIKALYISGHPHHVVSQHDLPKDDKFFLSKPFSLEVLRSKLLDL